MLERFEFVLTPEESADADAVHMRACKTARKASTSKVRLIRKSLDARGKQALYRFVAEVADSAEEFGYPENFRAQDVSRAEEVHIIGAGPAGLFAALQLIELGKKPVILERGKEVRDRRRDLAQLCRDGKVNPDSNYCFGEGGAGTYSDGKLYTRSDKRGDVPRVLKAFIDHGAAPEIAWEAHPHIGTNKLPGIIEHMREHIRSCGGQIHFNCRVDGLLRSSDRITHLLLADGSGMPVKNVILCTGHSARDIFNLLHREGILIEAKPFALGVRIEHPQTVVDAMRYKKEKRGNYLPPASYNLVEQAGGRGVFSFCMCPGGIIAPAATAPGEIVVNGWSPSKRNGTYANSGFVAAVDEADFAPWKAEGELRALAFQAHWEQEAFKATGSIAAPAQRMEDFLQQRNSRALPECSYIPGITSVDLRSVLPEQVHNSMRQALKQIAKKWPLYLYSEAVLVGVESRTSSPVRIPRDKETCRHPQIANLFPCGEGAGYAGGIMSAALDGMRVASAVSGFR
jgi:uncharacterized FAD-dependent dehydrogenase